MPGPLPSLQHADSGLPLLGHADSSLPLLGATGNDPSKKLSKNSRRESQKDQPEDSKELDYQRRLKEYEAKQMLTRMAHRIVPHIGKMYDEKLRKINVHMAVIACIILGLIIAYISVCFDPDTLIFDDNYEICPAAFWCKTVAWGLYWVFIERLITYYKIKCEEHCDKWGFANRLQAFWQTETTNFFLEAFINALIPFPATDNLGFEGYLIMTLIFFRLYLVLRVFRDFSPFWLERHKLGNMGAGKSKATIDSGTVAIAYFHTYTLLVVVLVGLSGILMLAYMMHLYERLLWTSGNFDFVRVNDNISYTYPGTTPADLGYSQTPFVSYSNCVWFVIVTGATVGYGDFAPRDWQGRFVAACTILFGLIMTSLLSSIVINELEPKDNEEAVQTWQAHIAAAKEMEYTAVRVIQIAWKTAQRNKKNNARKQRTAQELKAKNRKHRRQMRRVINPWLDRLRKAKKTFEETSELDSESLIEQMTRRSYELHKKLDKVESALQKRHPESFKQVESQYQKKKLAEATEIIKTVLRKNVKSRD